VIWLPPAPWHVSAPRLTSGELLLADVRQDRTEQFVFGDRARQLSGGRVMATRDHHHEAAAAAVWR
jgi:hypothetical protein